MPASTRCGVSSLCLQPNESPNLIQFQVVHTDVMDLLSEKCFATFTGNFEHSIKRSNSLIRNVVREDVRALAHRVVQ